MSKSQRSDRGSSRTQRPQRSQIEMRCLSLDQLVEPQHRVRIVWRYVESLDLTELYTAIQAVEGGVGRDAVDPQILFGLWLFATLEGISSGRHLTELTTRDIPYMWLCGGVSVNYHLLNDFRAAHADLLKRLLIDSVSVLLHQQLITLDEVAQDGMRVRASAGASSFRREATLAEAQTQAREHVERLHSEHAADPSGDQRRRQAARQRAAQECQEKITQALAELEKLKAQRDQQRREATSEPRASTTDPEARTMKMADGGFRPAFNVQFVTDHRTRLIVGVEVNNQGSDAGLMEPLHAQLCADHGVTPERYLVDGGFAKKEDVTTLERAGTRVYAPLPREKQLLKSGQNPYAEKRGDSPEMVAFRERMQTAEAKAIYKHRCSVAEFPNADCRNRGLYQFKVRGSVKAKAQVLWHALAYNLLRMVKLGFLEKVVAR